MSTTIYNKVSKSVKKVLPVCLFTFLPLLTSCNDWLDVLPNNEQVTDKYWKSKEDVESVIASGYYYMRQCVPTYIKWGELRGDALFTSNGSDAKLQDFNILPSNELCDWTDIYKVIGMANSVIKYAPTVNDKTYYNAMRNSDLAEAYFMRAYSYLLLVKNFKEVPLVLSAYVNDKASFDIAKSSEETIIEQIKKDVKAALETGAAKSVYEDEWATKGRVTKWALYALMADVCLWSGDYEECATYCDLILNASDTFRPVLMSNTSDWISLFYPGNSNESILEINWDQAQYGQSNNFSSSLFGTGTSSATLKPTDAAIEKMREETTTVLEQMGGVTSGRIGRMLLATYLPEGGEGSWANATRYYIWKYYVSDDAENSTTGHRASQDANFIIYRVAEVILMKAQALTMQGDWQGAIDLDNIIRKRAGLPDFETPVSDLDEQTLLMEILDQKEMEFMAEGKRWYDMLWLARLDEGKYKDLVVDMIVEGNTTTNDKWISSVLQDDNAWYMPLPQKDIDNNKLLKQNPYYATTK